jgi:PAS domain S-box-containing protein
MAKIHPLLDLQLNEKSMKDTPETNKQESISFSSILNLADIQHLQDLFADAHGVASIITNPDGTPITKPSNFTRLCDNLIRKTEKGCANCYKSDAVIGRYHPSGAVVQPCLSGGLWDAGASITVGGKHIANWLIGQVRNKQVDEQRMLEYADEIGVNRADFKAALDDVPVMPERQFRKIAELLFVFARELSEKAFSNMQLSRQIAEKEKANVTLLEREENLSITLHSIGDGVISTDSNGLVVRMNPVAEKLCGQTLTEASGKPLGEVFNIVNAISRKAIEDPVKKVLESGEIVGLANHTLLISKTGTEYQISDSAAPIRNKEGVITGVVLVFSDVTKSYIAQKQIRESEERYRSLLQNLDAGIVVHAPDTSILMSNHRASELLGLTDDQMRGKTAIDPAWKFIDEANTPLPLEKYPVNRIVRSKKPIKNQILGIQQPGQNDVVWVTVNGVPILNDEGGIIEILISFIDISERKRAEEQLRRSENNLTEAERIGNTGSWDYDVPSDSAIWSKNMYRIFDVDPNMPTELIFKHFVQNLVHPDDRRHVLSVFAGALNGTRPYDLEYRIFKKDGSTRDIHAIAETFFDENKKAIRMIGMAEDITEQKLVETELIKAKEKAEESEKEFRLLAESMPQIVWVTRADGWNIYFNQQWVDYTGLTLEESYGHGWNKPFHPDDQKRAWDAWQNAVNHNGTYLLECRLRDKDGLYRWWLIRGVPVLNKNGEISKWFGTCTDIHHIKLTESELIISKEKAVESDRLKSAFLANMSHEIRTPMNGILGFAELLKTPELTGEQQQGYIRIIERSGARMLNIINDIIDISKIEAGLIKPELKESNINEQTDYIYTFFKPEAEAKGLKLTLSNPLAAKEATITTDREKLYAILANLVKNAIKYTETGVIDMGCFRQGDTIEFYVKDTGIGIPANKREAIFERFVQADPEDRKARQGAGLGLAITKSYVEMMGGKIWVESEEGVGSTFYFSLPCPVEQVKEDVVQQQVPGKNPNHFRKLKIVIAEDDEASEMLIGIAVKTFGKEILKVRSGVEAVKICHENPDTDLILMDIQMPEMDGYEATRQIRTFNKKVIIIAQTAYALAGEREKALEAGCNDYLSKPIKQSFLLELLQKYFGK